jgi:hypothetical protein
VTDDHAGDAAWPFVGGTIKRVFIDVSGEPSIDLATEARAAFARHDPALDLARRALD